MLKVQLPTVMGLALLKPLSALQQLLGLALADHQACHLPHRTYALSSCRQNPTATLLLVDDKLTICLSGQATLALHQARRCWPEPQHHSILILVVYYHYCAARCMEVTTEACSLQYEQ